MREGRREKEVKQKDYFITAPITLSMSGTFAYYVSNLNFSGHINGAV